MSIDMAVIASERSSPSSSKKQSSVAVSLPSWPQTNRPVAWFETRVILWNLVCQVSAVRRVGRNSTLGTTVTVGVMPSSRGVGPFGLGTWASLLTSESRAA